jgi:hypothetical protein
LIEQPARRDPMLGRQIVEDGEEPIGNRSV